MKYSLLKNRLTGERAILNNVTKEKTLESINPLLYAELRKKAIVSRNKAEKEEALRSIGLNKCIINGKTFWE